MGLFGAIKNKFTDSISLSDSQKGLVVRQRLKKDSLKINQEVVVNDGFEVVTCHFDYVCDLLPTGKYKFNDVHMPKLYKHVKAKKTKKGFATPKAIPADIYYVSKTLFGGLTFKTPYKLKAKHGDKIVKIKVKGSFNITVANSHTFLAAMLSDYATIDSEQAKKEIGAYVSYAILNHTRKNLYSIEEFNNNSESLMSQLNEVVEKELKSIGLTLNELKITEIEPPVGVENLGTAKKEVKTIEEMLAKINATAELKKTKESDEAEVFVASGGETQTAKASVINLGFSGLSSGGVTSGGSIKKEERSSTLDEYEKASKSFNENLSVQKQPNLVFLNGEKKEIPYIPPANPVKKESVMQTVAPVKNSNILVGGNVADEFVQKNRRIELEALKKSIETPEDYGRPKVLKPGKEAVIEKTCSSCGAKYTQKDQFCPKCGRSTLNFRYCKACGEKNKNDAFVCKTCGSKL